MAAPPGGPTNPTLLAEGSGLVSYLEHTLHNLTGLEIKRGFVPGPGTPTGGTRIAFPKPTPFALLWAAPSPAGAVPPEWFGIDPNWAGFQFPDYSSIGSKLPEHIRDAKAAADAAGLQRNIALSKLEDLVVTVVEKPQAATTQQLQAVLAVLLQQKVTPPLVAAARRVKAELQSRVGFLQALQAIAPPDP